MYYTTEEALQYIINDSLMNDQGLQKSNLVYWLRETTQRNGLNAILKIMFNLQKSVAIKADFTTACQLPTEEMTTCNDDALGSNQVNNNNPVPPASPNSVDIDKNDTLVKLVLSLEAARVKQILATG